MSRLIDRDLVLAGDPNLSKHFYGGVGESGMLWALVAPNRPKAP